MSALGQKQTCAAQNSMSTLPPRHVRFAPKADAVICARRCGVQRIMTMLDRLMIA
jgi:hypothetical protein